MKRFKKLQPLAAVAVLTMVTALTANANPRNPTAHLSGSNEVPPVATAAQGEVVFRANADGSELSFRLTVANMENVVAAHIHSGEPGVNGPVVVLLFGGPTTSGRTNGVLAEGTITAGDLTGPLAGMTIADLLDLISAGGAYVNVHTDANPGGEIRGQLK